MIPGSSENLEKKAFNWTIDVINEFQVLLSFKFEHPVYISMDDLIDTVKISFWNTNLYMFPADAEKAAIPDGYAVTSELPPQLPSEY